MNESDVIIRPIRHLDNHSLAQIIRGILEEMNVPKEGTTYADKELDHIYETFSVARAAYFVVYEKEKLIGGAGIIHLNGEALDICELQKMYLLSEARGRGLGRRLLKICLQAAVDLNYKRCYLETMSDMLAAQRLYEKTGFRYLDQRLGATGHYVCPIWMIRELE